MRDLRESGRTKSRASTPDAIEAEVPYLVAFVGRRVKQVMKTLASISAALTLALGSKEAPREDWTSKRMRPPSR